jgi:glycosyltransferase involved in cell wall biosynthesis
MAALSAPWKLLRTPAIIALFIGGLPVRLSRLLLFIHRHQIDVVYTNTITVVDGAIAAKLSRRPHIWHLHENIDASEDLLKVLPGKNVASFLTLKLSSLIVVASHALGDQIFVNYLSMRNVKVIHNGVDTNRFSPNTPTNFLHRELGIPIGAPLVGICGEIQKSKGLEVFVKAASVTSQRLPKIHFLIIGEGLPKYVRHITDIANENGLSEKLHFTGWRADIPEIFRELAIVVIASKQESFGLTAIEGMATGIPVVATRCGGPEEVIEHGKTGYLVALDDDGEMAQRLMELLADAELQQRMGQAGRKQVEQRFTVDRCVKKVEQIIALADSQVYL